MNLFWIGLGFIVAILVFLCQQAVTSCLKYLLADSNIFKKKQATQKGQNAVNGWRGIAEVDNKPTSPKGGSAVQDQKVMVEVNQNLARSECGHFYQKEIAVVDKKPATTGGKLDIFEFFGMSILD